MRISFIHIILTGLSTALGIQQLHASTPGACTPEQTITFEMYLTRVKKHNLEFLADSVNVDIAKAEILAAKVLPDPSFDFEGSKDTYSLGISYTLELGKRHARVELARSQFEFEQTATANSFQQLRAEAADQFLEAILQRELLRAKRESCAYMIQLSKSDSLRHLAGEITEIEYRQSRLESMSLLNDVYDQEAAYFSSLADLNMLMGVTSDTLNVPAGDWENLERNFSLDRLLATGMKENLQIAEARKNIDVTTRALKLVRTEQRPDIDLSLSYERDWNSFRPQMQYAKVGVSIPLPFSSINKGAVRSAKYRIEQASIQEEEVCLRVRKDITQAWYAFEAEKKKVSQYRSGVLEDARKVLEGTVYMYKRGESGILDVLIAQRSYNQVQQDYLETMKSYASSLIALEKSCGMWDIWF